MGKVSNAFIDFACEYSNYNKLPERVIQGPKKVLLDGIGDALGGISSDMGKIGVSMARAMGGVPQLRSSESAASTLLRWRPLQMQRC